MRCSHVGGGVHSMSASYTFEMNFEIYLMCSSGSFIKNSVALCWHGGVKHQVDHMTQTGVGGATLAVLQHIDSDAVYIRTLFPLIK